ncbi:hypothetical protein AGMMS49949_00880 [Alphaproteobacteria bacterium]|nr:hypothetical protein AGMMS49949_00880 [Alphaproteobacteria bacterium]
MKKQKLNLAATLAVVFAAPSFGTLKRVDSKAVLNPWTSNEPRHPFTTMNGYIHIADRFAKKYNIYPLLGNAMREEYGVTVGWLKKLGGIFGFKPYDPSVQGVISIDISWPNLRRVIGHLLESTNEDNPETGNGTLTLGNLKWILHYLAPALDEIEKPSRGDQNKSGLYPTQINLLANWCTTRGLFREEAKKASEFQSSLKEIIANRTGFQRIMSLLCDFVLNVHNVGPFNHDLCGIKISSSKGQYTPLMHIVKYGTDTNTEAHISRSSSVNHELTHASHHMTGYSVRSHDARNTRQRKWLTNFSIMNSPKIDFVDEFFPMLKPERMAPVLAKLMILLNKASLETQAIQKDFCKKTIATAISRGFGNILFSHISETGQINMSQELLALCVYLDAYLLNDLDEDESDILSQNHEEKLTMSGKNILLIDELCFIIEDRQHEQIYNI